MQHRLEITIHGKAYALACSPGEEAEILKLAQYVDSRICQLGRQIPQAGEMTLLVLGLISMADDLKNYQTAVSANVPDENVIGEEQAGVIAAQIDKMAERVTKLSKSFLS